MFSQVTVVRLALFLLVAGVKPKGSVHRSSAKAMIDRCLRAYPTRDNQPPCWLACPFTAGRAGVQVTEDVEVSTGKDSDVRTYSIVEQPGGDPVLAFSAGGYSHRCIPGSINRPEISLHCSANQIRIDVEGGESIQLHFNPESRLLTPGPELLRRLTMLERRPTAGSDTLAAIERFRKTLALFDDLTDEVADQKGWRDLLGIRPRLTALAARAHLAEGDWLSAEAEIEGGILTPGLSGPRRDELDAEIQRAKNRPGPLRLSHPVRLTEVGLDPKRTWNSEDFWPWLGKGERGDRHLFWRGTSPCVAEVGTDAGSLDPFALKDVCYDGSSGKPKPIAAPTDGGVAPGSTFVTSGACGELVSMGGIKTFYVSEILAALPDPAVLLEKGGRFVAEGPDKEAFLDRADVNSRLLVSSGSRILGLGRYRLVTDATVWPLSRGGGLLYAETGGSHRVWQLPLPGLPPNSSLVLTALISPDQTQLLAAVLPHAANAFDLWLFHIDEIAVKE
ncbi:MAG: hypothetical protein ACYDCL_17740 [Myxococcales bacterium]